MTLTPLSRLCPKAKPLWRIISFLRDDAMDLRPRFGVNSKTRHGVVERGLVDAAVAGICGSSIILSYYDDFGDGFTVLRDYTRSCR